jgi:hypothetical protein
MRFDISNCRGRTDRNTDYNEFGAPTGVSRRGELKIGRQFIAGNILNKGMRPGGPRENQATLRGAILCLELLRHSMPADFR